MNVVAFLEVLEVLTNLFDCGCEINLDTQDRGFGVVGRDYGSEALMESEANEGHSLQTSYIERVYSCDPYKLVNEGTPEEDYVFDATPVNFMIEQIRKDNEAMSAKKRD